jgi:putative (di)nucleoside polyphosphate hydrolase
MKLTDNVFRANVGAIIVNHNDDVLAFERLKLAGAWQLPQGGLNEGEDPRNAVIREVCEETGLVPDDLEILGESLEWIAYELPHALRNQKVGRGQVQKWFKLRLRVDADSIDFAKVKEREFSSWKWVRMSELTKQVVDFRKPIYVKLMEIFQLP